MRSPDLRRVLCLPTGVELVPARTRLRRSLQNRIYYFRFFEDFLCWLLCCHQSDQRLAAFAQTLGVVTQDVLCRLGLMAWGLAAVIVPTRPSPSGWARKSSNRLTKRLLPRNPLAYRSE
jgi:hypothetical protein